jgi:hypothetical protein
MVKRAGGERGRKEEDEGMKRDIPMMISSQPNSDIQCPL